MWEVSVLSDLGREWRLVNDPDARVAIKAGGMSGMVATSSETAMSVVGRPGARPVTSRVESLAPSWDLVFVDRDGSGLGEDLSEWFKAWRSGVTVSVASSMGKLSTRGRMPPDADEVFEINPYALQARWRSLEMPWPWVADRPVWEVARSGTGEVRVVNYGDVPAIPSVSWEGSGRSITVRGVTIPLPSVPGGAVMVLDHADNCVVTDRVGTRLMVPSAWSRTRALDLSVVVQPGSEETITVSDGVTLSWTVGVKSPWR